MDSTPWAVIAAAVVLTGCATVFDGPSKPVSIRSTAPDATFELTNRAGKVIHSGKAPVRLTLDNGAYMFVPEKYSIRMQAPGYEGTTATLGPNLNPWYFGNIFLGGAIGMLLVDPLTGAMYKLPDEIEVPMRASDTTAATQSVESAPATTLAAPSGVSRYGRYQVDAERFGAAMGCSQVTVATEQNGIGIYTAMCGGQPTAIRCEWQDCAIQH